MNQMPSHSTPEGFDTDSCKVYLSYDPSNPPAHPGENWTRFICISDTHSHTFIVPPGDVLLHSGDLSRLGREDEIRVTIKWLRGLEHPVKMCVAHHILLVLPSGGSLTTRSIIAGNHDLPLHREWYENSHHRFHGKRRVRPFYSAGGSVLFTHAFLVTVGNQKPRRQQRKS
jgi:hypothetical protein